MGRNEVYTQHVSDMPAYRFILPDLCCSHPPTELIEFTFFLSLALFLRNQSINHDHVKENNLFILSSRC
jgi:hypothetical protein